jgi:hypothetical protein
MNQPSGDPHGSYGFALRTLLDALAVPPQLTVTQWAESRRVLPSTASEPGPWRTDRTPYLAGIMDALSPGDPAEIVVVMKSAQLGMTGPLHLGRGSRDGRGRGRGADERNRRQSGYSEKQGRTRSMRGHVLGAITALSITYPVQAQGDFILGRWHPSTYNSASFALAPDRAELLSMSTAIGTGNALITTTLWKGQWSRGS